MQIEERTGPKNEPDQNGQDPSASRNEAPSVNTGKDPASPPSSGAINQTSQDSESHPHEDAMKNHGGVQGHDQGKTRQDAPSFLDSDDEIGITITDDELWEDTDGLDEVPLFDEEELIGDGPAEDEQAATKIEDDAARNMADREQGQPGSVRPDSSSGRTSDENERPGDVSAEGEPVQSDEPVADDLFTFPPWLTWVISGIGFVFIIAGILVLWELAGPYLRGEATDVAVAGDTSGVSRQKADIVQSDEGSSNGSKDHGNTLQSKWPSRGIEAIDLAPFLIPAQREGELVFFKLKVELIVPDATTKHALKKKEAWVRDIIYTQLKGIDVNPGEKGNILLKYRRPLLKKLNKRLSPLEIQDIRIMGFLLK